jgi:hypothetical protein
MRQHENAPLSRNHLVQVRHERGGFGVIAAAVEPHVQDNVLRPIFLQEMPRAREKGANSLAVIGVRIGFYL